MTHVPINEGNRFKSEIDSLLCFHIGFGTDDILMKIRKMNTCYTRCFKCGQNALYILEDEWKCRWCTFRFNIRSSLNDPEHERVSNLTFNLIHDISKDTGATPLAIFSSARRIFNDLVDLPIVVTIDISLLYCVSLIVSFYENTGRDTTNEIIQAYNSKNDPEFKIDAGNLIGIFMEHKQVTRLPVSVPKKEPVQSKKIIEIDDENAYISKITEFFDCHFPGLDRSVCEFTVNLCKEALPDVWLSCSPIVTVETTIYHVLIEGCSLYPKQMTIDKQFALRQLYFYFHSLSNDALIPDQYKKIIIKRSITIKQRHCC